MIFSRLQVEGFGSLIGRDVRFDTGLSVVVGPNEAGKSTLSAVVLALLYGHSRGDKDAWRPWSGARYAAVLHYTLADGRSFEIRRDFERDAKGVRVYDAHGNDASAECAIGKSIVPGHAHLGIPLEVFVNAAFVAQGDVAIDTVRADRIADALARALDGGPKEDAALGAIKRLDDAAALHIGKKRATINAPLRNLVAELAAAEARARDMRARLLALDSLRTGLAADLSRSETLAARLREHERRVCARRALDLRARLDALREIRDELAALHAERERYADVADFDAAAVPAFEERYHGWNNAQEIARARAAEAERWQTLVRARAGDADDAPSTLDEATFARVERAAAEAHKARCAADEAAANPSRLQRKANFVRGPLAAGTAAALSALGLSAAHDWTLALVGAAAAFACFLVGLLRSSERRSAGRAQTAAARRAAAAAAVAAGAESELKRLLQPFTAATFEELARRKLRDDDDAVRRAEAALGMARAREAVERAEVAAKGVDALLATLVPAAACASHCERTRGEAFAVIRQLEARKRARDGLELRLSMLALRRSDVLGSDQEFALEAELGELTAAGVVAVDTAVPARELEAERRALERSVAESRAAVAARSVELRAAESQIGDLAALDEHVLQLQERAARLERFDRALTLARGTIEERTRERHERFAFRLAEYASQTLARVTGEKYLDVRVDPATLAVRLRVPDTGDIVGLDRLSAGTREQAYLVVRLAMARMLSEGLETAPLLLDDPFAYWDAARIDRALPLLQAAACDGQVILFSTSEPLAREAVARGAQAIYLGGRAQPAFAQRFAV